ncbi:homeobox transcription factor, putative [Metarhizium acridum CQMa 102]|uniref:Homeobox transcription factor, putative n=1 Tax=Metarhizium acridum (strain CQMa 102) TaxID=655827 RepID=E9EIA0_METAQ|nr:homeobox transcription factor, putative [Metarhizium acridum CQMa 102]EFY84346.1 homeobox transcription factor, putative [Metarhizium acridum CQMa 102]
MSEKQSLPSPLEPEWQGQYPYSRLETNPYQRPFLDTRNNLDRHGAKSTTPMRHQYQSQDLRIESLTHDALGRPTSSLYGTTSTGSKPSGTISRDSLGTDLSPYPRLTEAYNPYRSQGYQTPGTELAQPERDDKERGSSQDAEFDVYDDDAHDPYRGSHFYHQTVAERIAARRKMKRFRLTPQQTRFLMGEFAKQPHPDATLRERLSREIPGLSPRQVQVWFQNRRAKMKRVTINDRERMIQMRAVPDNFDNLQALHSPYSAVNGIGASPSNLGPMVPPHRSAFDNGRIPSFGHIG